MSNLVLTRRPKESIHITLEDGRVITVTILHLHRIEGTTRHQRRPDHPDRPA